MSDKEDSNRTRKLHYVKCISITSLIICMRELIMYTLKLTLKARTSGN